MALSDLPRPFIAIIGRPNVGKSTLFNRLVGRRLAIVQDQPGVTRDRNYHAADYCGTAFTLIDTGGIVPEHGPAGAPSPDLLAQVQHQTDVAIQEADTLIYLMDGREGLSPVDLDIVERLRKVAKPVWYAVNKIDGPKHEDKLYDFYQLGVDRLFPISAEHGYGLDELLETAIPPRDQAIPEPEPEELPKIIVLGRPNVGKSTLINTILGEERLVTSQVPGTTRDTIDTVVERRGKPYRFIDTAGIRRRGKIGPGVEYFSVARAQDALARADIALVMIDAGEGVVEQETKITGEVLAAGKGCILLINKWDLAPKGEDAKQAFLAEVNRRFSFVEHAPRLFLSALKGTGVGRIFAAIDEVAAAYTKRIATGDLNRFFDGVMRDHPPPLFKGRAVRLYYITQASVKPPTFVAFSNAPSGLPANYHRYLENALRKQFGFTGSPIRIVVRMKKGRG